MAACAKGLDKFMFSLRLLRNLRLENERSISTSMCRLVPNSEEPPKFTPPSKPVIVDKTQSVASLRKFLSPEFTPPRQRTDPLKFSIERKDMIRRRKVLNIPEFYVGSILAVTMADPNASGKTNRFVGICIQRGGKGLGATFVLRNIIDNQGVEICYELYSPRIQKIDVLKLEKRLDDNLMYLRDAIPEYSTVDPDMKPVPFSPTGEVPVNKVKVRMRPKPWSKRWERPKFNIQGIRFDLSLTPEQMEHAQKWAQPWQEYDMLKEYDTSELEVQILGEVQQELSK
ncbi:39S ribosomal protein L19, mitochondrial isoform X2 [Etheostoma cragini]|uniref:39S ribosomal protein L19, mitochondrial isoform X2 n=1 Tax=Etheostoma cragini TaxID=417921 RepID=UPI00155EC27A|nr:39S ribosomal protein L19, mitochondrial isoform X2 [Etheostoma cragini]